MNRDEFMAQIARLLADMPESERMEAIRYYNDYLDEAGEENEEQAIRELGDPREIAASIKANLQENETAQTNENIQGTETAHNNYGSYVQNTADSPQPAKRTGHWVRMVILLVLASPLLIGLAGSLLGVILGILGAVIGIVFACLASGVSLALGGIALIVKGVWNLFRLPALGLAGVGGGLLCVSVGILLLLLFVWFVFQIVPRLWLTGKRFVSGRIHRRKGGQPV